MCIQKMINIKSKIIPKFLCFPHREWLGASNEEATPADLDLRSECLSKPFQEMHFTPRKNAHTPMKTLPFSPSQVRFLNSNLASDKYEQLFTFPTSFSAIRRRYIRKPSCRRQFALQLPNLLHF